MAEDHENRIEKLSCAFDHLIDAHGAVYGAFGHCALDDAVFKVRERVRAELRSIVLAPSSDRRDAYRKIDIAIDVAGIDGPLTAHAARAFAEACEREGADDDLPEAEAA